MKYSRIFLLVLDSWGSAQWTTQRPTATREQTHWGTLRTGRNGSPSPACCVWGISDLPEAGFPPRKAYRFRHADERKSAGKDTMTGHWELMGSLPPPFFTFTQTGFPAELIGGTGASHRPQDCGQTKRQRHKNLEELGSIRP